MTVFVCIDNNNGMLFNSRRQSRDKCVIEDIAEFAENKNIFVHPYSQPLFADAATSVQVAEDFLSKANADDFCFVEHAPLAPYAQKIDTVVLYHWNRIYPADTYLDFLPSQSGFTLQETKDFPGNSHDKITREVYRKCK